MSGEFDRRRVAAFYRRVCHLVDVWRASSVLAPCTTLVLGADRWDPAQMALNDAQALLVWLAMSHCIAI